MIKSMYDILTKYMKSECESESRSVVSDSLWPQVSHIADRFFTSWKVYYNLI